ncbi:nuclear transport factor 2 family protein [Glycomyces terrestris]|uniref:Nuclear transport factor 2 family protein n=1 Tax=Glycomyces terrestris TaxID=2493553 RepID=A0A426URR1_9ACTN|nr:nuclear transport factor 2 family protein [Glycomyces terrestris]RRR95661.1 nuclear transport factor 2 family protein [Glycomyces terrestris]
MTPIETLVRDLADRAELTELLARQSRWLDDRAADRTGEVFTDDAVARTPGGEVSGAAAVAELALGRHREYERTIHATHSVAVELAGDEAVVECGVKAVFVLRDREAVQFVDARYRFDARRTERGWRFASIAVTPLARTGDVARHR